jgi:hypothetical protein
MAVSDPTNVSRKWGMVALVFSGFLIVAGLVISLVIDDWIALICASGVAILPLGVFLARSRK